MKRLLHIVPALLAAAMALTGCGDESCYGNGSGLPLATLCVGPVQTTVPGLTVKGIDVPGDSLLADNRSLHEIYLPLRASVTSTSYAVTRVVTVTGADTTVSDTLTIDYTPVAFFHSKECGVMYNFDIKHISHTCNGIDSVVLLTPLVTNSTAPALCTHFTDFSS